MDAEDVTTREQWIDFAGGRGAAVGFEEQALAIGVGLLPEVAELARAGNEPTPGYWRWLASQWVQAE